MEKKEKRLELLEVGRCKKCGAVLKEYGLGIYVCPSCGNETLSEFGMVKKCIEDNGPQNVIEISKMTGVSENKIMKFLREGRIEIPENSNIFIPCEKCGVDIRYGRYCPACAAQLSKQLKGAFSQSEVGEIPRKNTGKMRFFDNNEK